MKYAIATLVSVLALSACSDSRPQLTNREKYICGQCHKLPSADQHAAAEWPAVVARMMNHMQSNNRTMPTEQEQEEIIKYYQSHAGQ
jgi:hypothetical protein